MGRAEILHHQQMVISLGRKQMPMVLSFHIRPFLTLYGDHAAYSYTSYLHVASKRAIRAQQSTVLIQPNVHVHKPQSYTEAREGPKRPQRGNRSLSVLAMTTEQNQQTPAHQWV